MRYLKLFILVFSTCLTIASCRQIGGKSTAEKPHFYYWKTSMAKDTVNWQLMKTLSGDHPLYLRLFDVDYSAGYADAIPVGPFDAYSFLTDGRPVVPTVYINNRVFIHLEQEALQKLASRVQKKIFEDYLSSFKNTAAYQLTPYNDSIDWQQQEKIRDSIGNRWLDSVDEIQIDCDWTPSTREKYFAFLNHLKQTIVPKKISCTVRLHQYRERDKNGIPPVDRGVLMCYNVADAGSSNTQNAILDPALVKGYLKAGNYPIPLDIALPIFSWGAWFREDEFRGLVHGISSLKQHQRLLKPLGQNRYQIVFDTVIENNYFRQGDWIRDDYASSKDLMETGKLLRTVSRQHSSRILFFDWDNEKIKAYENDIKACMDIL